MKRTLWAVAFFGALSLSAQPQFPQHSTGWPAVQPPAIDNHITNLSRTIAGRPSPSRPGARPIYAAPIYYGGGGWLPQADLQSPPVVLVNQQNIAPAPAPILVINPDYKPEVAKPSMREYSTISNPYENFTPSTPKIFLLALKDGTLRQSVAFWREEGKLHYVRPDHKQESLTYTDLDLESTRRFNQERGIEIKLPE